jgi:hypothetical protein
MKRGLFCIAVVFVMIFAIDTITFSSGNNIIRIQGRVMEVDLGNKIMVVNERTFVWDQNTAFYNDRGSPATVDSLRRKTWVYLEGVKDATEKSAIAQKIYILPKYIPGEERHLYPFFQSATTSKIE